MSNVTAKLMLQRGVSAASASAPRTKSTAQSCINNGRRMLHPHSSKQWLRMKSTRPSYVAPVSAIPPPPRQRTTRQSQGGETTWGTSYREWGKRPQRTSWGQQQPQQNQGEYGGLVRFKPQKHNSLIYFPDEVTLKYPTTTSEAEAVGKSLNKNESKPFELTCQNFAISKAEANTGNGNGHVLIGPNGSGKSLLVKYLTSSLLEDVILDSTKDQSYVDYKLLDESDHQVAYVSFESHYKLLEKHPHYTVHNVITSGGGIGNDENNNNHGGNLNKIQQYLVVRFGLYPLLHRTISTLSTGEIRKTLLVAALCSQPHLLILENPFDGLDLESREELRSIVSKTLKGLSNSGKLLITGVSPEYVPPTQILITTHRPEDVVDDISTISVITTNNKSNDQNNKSSSISSSSSRNNNKLLTFERPMNWSKEQILYTSLGVDKDYNKDTTGKWNIVEPWNDTKILKNLPSIEEIRTMWMTSRSTSTKDHATTTNKSNNKKPLISLKDVNIRRYQDGQRDGVSQRDNGSSSKDGDEQEFATLLHNLSWDIELGQHWFIVGGNGAGKSTLSRFLLSSSNDNEQQHQDHHQDHDHDDSNVKDTTRDYVTGTYEKDDTNCIIGWVSTESHVSSMMNNNNNTGTFVSAYDMITHNGVVSDEIATTMISWVFDNGIDQQQQNTNNTSGSNNIDEQQLVTLLKTRSINELSQGQQKLVLLTSALAKRPNLLVLDEITQGLDYLHRRHILALLERICQATTTNNDNDNYNNQIQMSLLYITHYQQEEDLPSITNILHLDHGEVIYQGRKSQ